MAETLTFDENELTLRNQEVVLNGTSYTIYEASAEDARKYQEVILKGAEVVDGKPVRLGAGSMMGPLMLLQRCMKETQSQKCVTEKLLAALPHRVFDKLSSICLTLSELSGKKDSDEDTDEDSRGNE